MKKSSFHYLPHSSILLAALLFFMCIAASCSLSKGRYVKTRNNGCSVFDPDPVEGQILEWSGDCSNGYASGYGQLSVFENQRIHFMCSGEMREGRFSGSVTFAIYKEDQILCEYEDEWHAGFPTARIRNLTLEKHLEDAENARHYLHRLARYRKAHPDVWIDDFHEILLKKVTFACVDIVVNEPLSLHSDDSGKKQFRKGKIFKNELLLQIHEDGRPEAGYYTVYNTRVVSLKQLASDRYRPGGAQFHILRSSKICSDKEPPAEIPRRYAPVAITTEEMRFVDEENLKAPFWHPQRRY